MLLESCIEGLNLPNSLPFSFTERNCPNPENRAQFNQNGPRKSTGEHFLWILKLFGAKTEFFSHLKTLTTCRYSIFRSGSRKTRQGDFFPICCLKLNSFFTIWIPSWYFAIGLGTFPLCRNSNILRKIAITRVAWQEKYHGQKKSSSTYNFSREGIFLISQQ